MQTALRVGLFPDVRSLSVAIVVALVAGHHASRETSAAEETGKSLSMVGFTEERAKEQAALEGRFDSFLKAEDQRDWMEQMASAPNHVGSPHDKVNAEFMLGLFREWGWDARIETFEVLYPTPKKTALELVAPVHFTARLQEPAIPGDRTSTQTADELPPYHAYGADGDVTGELVYVNQGMPDDYKELARHGIDVKGRIVITRYGGGWRGLKPKLAYEHGAIGCLIYSDPRDDGYGEGDVYPERWISGRQMVCSAGR
jgi:N-acetylated-alpha-linked acidic dipeptidase